MKFQKMKVSIVIPSLNRAKYIKETIDSVLNQDYSNIECIVIDGGSTDGTIDILKSYGERIKWISEPDRGHADAINKGWRMATGEILSWLNADDILKIPDAISTAVKLFEENPDVDVVYGDCGRIDENGKKMKLLTYCRSWDLKHSIINCDHCIPQPASFIRRRIIEKVGYLDTEIFTKDRELWLRIGIKGKIKYFPFLFAYERHIKGISFQGKKVAEALVKIVKKFYSLPDVPQNLKKRDLIKRAYSNAYLRGISYLYHGGPHWLLIFRNLLMAMIFDPFNQKEIIDNIYRYVPFLKILKPFYVITFKKFLQREKEQKSENLLPGVVLDLIFKCIKSRDKILLLGEWKDYKKNFKNNEIEIFEKGNFFEHDFRGFYDKIICFNFLENLGVNYKYGLSEEPAYSDIDAMRKLGKIMKSSTDLILILPVGEDAIFMPYKRIYGKYRLELIFKHFGLIEEKFFDEEKEVAKDFALRYQSNVDNFLWGLFILRKK